jgi:epoxide hydrolase-like predicted phosphatase
MIKAAIFDIGGVLLRWTNLPLFEDVDQTLRITEEQRNEHWLKYMDVLEVGKITEKEFWEGFIKDTKAEGTLPSESLLQRQFKKRFTVDIEMIKIPHKLQENGLKIGIISNTIAPHAEVIKNSQSFEGFDEFILSNEVGFRKPEKEIYELAAKRLGVKPEEAFFVDDLPVNVSGANAVGIHGILFENREIFLNDLKTLGVNI